MFTLPNFLSLLRIPLAILFIYDNIFTRTISVCLAAMTDFFDGYTARRFKISSRYGTIIDPVSDKFFVVLALSLFYAQGQISLLEMCAMLCRDFAVIIFGIYLISKKSFQKYQFRAIWCGKIATTLQLCILLALTFQWIIPGIVYTIFIFIGFCALIELYLSDFSLSSKTN